MTKGIERLVLASASPRRSELLRQVGLEFDVQPPPDVEDGQLDGESPVDHARRSAEAKALAVSKQCPGALVLGADTVVALGGEALGKPADAAEARGMLAALSGRAHRVHTGVSLARDRRALVTEAATTEVVFRELAEAEIDAYVGTGEPLDKAGAYGIQGRGALLVESVRGCYSNVVGLPLSRTYELLLKVGRGAFDGNGDP